MTPRLVALSSLVLIGLALAAFWPMYLSKPFAAVDGYTHLHAAAGAAWMAMLVAQPLLISRRRLDLHRLLGRASYLLAPLFVASGIFLAHFRFTAMDDARFRTEAFSLYLPLFSAIVFAAAWILGVRYKGHAALHARFMAATALLLIDPVVGRILFFYFPPLPALPLYQLFGFVLADAVMVALIVSYRPRGTGRGALLAFGAFLLLAQALWFTLAPTASWLAFATWFRGLPLS